MVAHDVEPFVLRFPVNYSSSCATEASREAPYKVYLDFVLLGSGCIMFFFFNDLALFWLFPLFVH